MANSLPVNLLATATVSAANTATRITAGESVPATRVAANSCLIQALSNNSASIYVGDSSVTSVPTKGIGLSPGQSLAIEGAPAPNSLNLAEIYFASDSSTAKINVIYAVD